MIRYMLYELGTGLILPGVITAPSVELPHAADGLGVIVGEHNPARSRVDLASGEVIPWMPPKPADTPANEWIWDEREAGWVARPTVEALALEVRAERDRRLQQADKPSIRAFDRGEATPSAWAAYKEALRAIPEQFGFPVDVTWPTPPAD